MISLLNNLVLVFLNDTLHGCFSVVFGGHFLAKVARLIMASSDHFTFRIAFALYFLNWFDYLLLMQTFATIDRRHCRYRANIRHPFINPHIDYWRWVSLALQGSNRGAPRHG